MALVSSVFWVLRLRKLSLEFIELRFWEFEIIGLKGGRNTTGKSSKLGKFQGFGAQGVRNFGSRKRPSLHYSSLEVRLFTIR